MVVNLPWGHPFSVLLSIILHARRANFLELL